MPGRVTLAAEYQAQLGAGSQVLRKKCVCVCVCVCVCAFLFDLLTSNALTGRPTKWRQRVFSVSCFFCV